MSKFIDLTGLKFGRLLVIQRADDRVLPSGVHKIMWNCKCDCGNENIIVDGSHLKEGVTKSCGCLNRELASKRTKKYNIYDLSNDYGIGYTTNTNRQFYFDLDDYDKIKDFCWRETPYGYIATNYNGNSSFFLHRLVMNDPRNKIIDHINHNKYDNRKDNLRICTNSQNGMNTKIKSTNTSGYTGVSFNKTRNKWVATIMINYKTINLGYFDNIDDAVQARKVAEEKYFGEYRYNAYEYNGEVIA